MTVHISFNIINDSFNQQYAKEYHGGRESDGNMRYHNVWGYKITDVKEVELIKNTIYQLKGKLGDGTEINFSIPNITMFRCHLESGKYVDYAVSKSVLSKTQKTPNEKYKTMRCYFHLHSEPASVFLGTALINTNELPPALNRSTANLS